MERDLETFKPVTLQVSRVPDKTPESVDTALTFLNDIGRPSSTAEEDERLVRKIDWLLMPLLGMVYFLQFLDKNLSMLMLMQVVCTQRLIPAQSTLQISWA